MTTTVTVEAHCDEKKEVHIDICEDPCNQNANHKKVLQNGDKHSLVVYDNKSVTVMEILKQFLLVAVEKCAESTPHTICKIGIS